MAAGLAPITALIVDRQLLEDMAKAEKEIARRLKIKRSAWRREPMRFLLIGCNKRRTRFEDR